MVNLPIYDQESHAVRQVRKVKFSPLCGKSAVLDINH